MNKKNLLRLFGVLLLFILLTACGENAHEATDQPVSRQRPQIPDGNPDRGEELIRQYGCGSCHEIPGIRAADGNVGPPLNNWADRQYIAGALPNTAENLIHWIRFPQAVEPGTVMPNLDVTEEEARDIAAYLYTLTDEKQFTDVFSTPRAAIGGLFPGSSEAEAEAEGEGSTGEGQSQQQGEVPNTGQQSGESQGQGGHQLVQQGEQVFSNNCAQCHGQNGEGQVGPDLSGNNFVTSQDPAPVIDTVLHGRGQMPAFQEQLSNEQIAAVISFIRTAWDNNASTVSPDQIGSGQGNQQGAQTGESQGQSGENQSQQPSATPVIEDLGGQHAQVNPQPTAAQQGQTPQPEQQDQTGQQQPPTLLPQTGNQIPAAPEVVMVELYEWGIDISNTTVPAERVLFHVTNVGTQPHRFTIEGQGMELAFPEDIQVGQTRTVLANLRPGNYNIFCPLEDHTERGMRLEFTAAEIEEPALPRNQEQSPTPAQPSGEATPTPGSQQGGQNQYQQVAPTPTQGTQDQSGGDQGQGGQQGSDDQLVQQGEQVFSNNCAQCHGQNGEGQVGPALAGNNFVTSQDPAPVIDIVLHGRGQMPAFQEQLSNEQIAAVISFVRNTWGNSASTISPDQIEGSQSSDPSGGQSQQGGQSGQQGGQQAISFDLVARNRAFDQNTLTVPVGSSVTVNLTNQDNVPHNFAVYQDSTASQAIFTGQTFTGPGQTVTMQFTAPAEAGTYYFRCDVHPFMNGVLIVE